MRCAVICSLGFSTAALANPNPIPEPRPITELDVYRDMAELWRLAGLEESIVVRGGAGAQDSDAIGTFELVYRADYRSWRELLPNTYAIGIWSNGVVPFSIGWQLDIGIFSAPYVTANALATWDPSTSELAFGFDAGLGYEHRMSIRWAIAGDVRFQALWPADGMDEAPWGVRTTLSLRRYFD